jgi:hypothetical protein
MSHKQRRLSITIFEIDLNPAQLAEALWVDADDAVRGMSDGRVAARWAEHWGARVGDLVTSTNSNERWHDASTTVSSADVIVSNKCLTSAGVKFQASKYTGSGRTCTQENLLESLDATELVQVVDVTDMPKVRIITLHTRLLRAEVRAGRLTPSGWSKTRLEEFLSQHYECTVVNAREAERGAQ